MESYRELRVWQGAVDVVVEVYRVTQGFPAFELYGLTSQIRRAAVSVPSNIAEGWGRATTAEYIRFLTIARGSLMELETQLIISGRLAYLPQEELSDLMDQTTALTRGLNALIANLRNRP